jgi:ABC-2 type transport system permease protein
VLLRDLRDQVRSLVGWSLGVVATIALMGAFWPSVRDMPELERFSEAYPAELREVLGIEAMTSGPGFFNVELFSILLPLIFLVFGISRGARLLAGEEANGTLEVLATLSVPRIRILFEKVGALAASLLALGIVTFVATWATGAFFSMGIPASEALAGTAAMVLLGLEFGLISMAVGAVTGRPGLAVAISSAVAVASYILYLAGALVEALESWRIVSPFQQALEGGPIGGGWRMSFLAMGVVGLVAVLAAVRVFDRRDIGR